MSDQMTQLAVSPYLYYKDGITALDFLLEAFGFEERSRDVRDDGTLNHADIAYRNATIMLGTPQNDDGAATVEPGAQRDCSLMVYVDDLDAHHERAQQAGATIVDEPMDEPYGRVYCARDPEGFRWYFCQVS